MPKKIVILLISTIAFILLTLTIRNSYLKKQLVEIKEIHDAYETNDPNTLWSSLHEKLKYSHSSDFKSIVEGYMYLIEGESKEASKQFDNAVTFKKYIPREMQLEKYNLIIDTLIHEEEYEQAVKYINKAYKHMNIYAFNNYPKIVWEILSKLNDTPDGFQLLRKYIDEILQSTHLKINAKVFFLKKMETLCILEMDYLLAIEYIVDILYADNYINHDYYKGKVLVDLAIIAQNLGSSEMSVEILENMNSQISPIDDPLKAADLEMYRLINLSQNKNKVGRYDEALEDLQKAYEYVSVLSPAIHEEIEYIIKTREAQIYIATGRLEEGKEILYTIYSKGMLDKLQVYGNTYVDYLIAVGDLHLASGNYEKAKTIYEYVIENDLFGTDYNNIKSALLSLSIIEENLGNHAESEKFKLELEDMEKCWNKFKIEMLYKYVNNSKEAKSIAATNSKMKLANTLYSIVLIIAFLIILKTVAIPRYKVELKKNIVMKNMKEGNYFLVYQPIVNPRTNEIAGVETLLRLKNQDKILSPNAFLKDIEASKMMDKIVLWQLKEIKGSYEDIQGIPNKSSSFYISINISLNEVKNKKFIKKLIAEGTDLIKNRSLICLEITENVGITDENLIKLHIEELIEAGFKIAIDDFGIEYSNISMLDQFDFHTLKLDKYFIDHMMDSVIVKNLFKVVNDISRELKITVVVEGVEEQWQVEELLNNSDFPLYIQGYYFSKPLEIHELKDFTLV